MNLQSGSGRGHALAARLAPWCPVRPIDFAALPELLAEAATFKFLLVAGGDGTLSAVLTSPGLLRTPVLPIPLGTANDLCRELGSGASLLGLPPEGFRAALDTAHRQPLSVWTGRSDDRSFDFCNYCSIGFEGDVLRHFSEWRGRSENKSRLLNRLAYGAIGLRHLRPRLSSFELVADSQPPLAFPSSSLSLVFANIKSYMGLAYSNDVGSSGDTTLECVRTSSALDYMRMFLSGVRLARPPRIAAAARRFELRGLPADVNVQADGEFLGELGEGPVIFEWSRQAEILTLAKSAPVHRSESGSA